MPEAHADQAEQTYIGTRHVCLEPDFTVDESYDSQDAQKDDDKDAAMSAVEEKEILFRSMTAMEAIQKEGLKAQLATELTFAKEVGPELSEAIIRGFEASDFVGTFGKLSSSEVVSATTFSNTTDSTSSTTGAEILCPPLSMIPF